MPTPESIPPVTVIDWTRECTQKQYHERTGKSLSQISNEIKSGKLHVRHIPELDVRLIQMDSPFVDEDPVVQLDKDLYQYSGKDLAFFFSKIMADYPRMAQEIEQLQGERDELASAKNQLTNEVNSLNDTMNRLHAQLDEVTSLNETIKKANNDLNSQLGSARAKNSELSHLLTVAQNEQKNLNQQLQDAVTMREHLAQELNTTQEMMKALQQLQVKFDPQELVAQLSQVIKQEVASQLSTSKFESAQAVPSGNHRDATPAGT